MTETFQDYNPARPVDEHIGVKALRDVASKMAFLDDTNPSEDAAKRAVQLMTLHKAKGLEFSVVVLVGLDESGIFPRGHERYDLAETEQQKNMVYVGVTRTRNLLVVSGVDPAGAPACSKRQRRRGAHSQLTAGPPSIFLSAMYKGFGVPRCDLPDGRPGYPYDEVRATCVTPPS